METGQAIVFVGLLIFLAHLFVALFERTRVPDVLYLTLIGVIIGPVLQIVSPGDFGKLGPVFTTVALVVILFEGGLELSLENLRKSLKGTVLITILSYFISLVLIAAALLMLTNLIPRAAIFVAAVLAGPAPSVVIPIARQLKLTDTSRTTLMLESPLGEALCIIVSLAILETFKVPEELHVGLLVGKLLSSFAFAFVIGALGGYVWSLLLNRMRQLRNAIFTTPSFVFIVFGIAEFLGYSGPVAALTFGIMLGNIDFIKIPKVLRKYDLKPLRHNETEKQFFGEIVFVVKTFFFVFIGLSVQFTDKFSLGLAFALCGVLLAARLFATRISVGSSTPVEDALAMSVMIPKGTAAAVLAGIPLQLSLTGGALIQNLTYGVVIFSIILTAVLIFLLEKTSFGAANRWLFEGFSFTQPTQSAPVRQEDASAEEKKNDAGGSRYL
ncbi:MAG: cation:proton antiporter [Ignavibacteriae bacterium]|nr:cation:proton antiporter [Ignavibacteriota bacterium]